MPPSKKSHKKFLVAAIVIIVLLTGCAVFIAINSFSSQNNEREPDVPFIPTNDDPSMDVKPIIYLYPQQTQQTNVTLDYRGTLAVTYPEYGDGWHVVANPDGTILNLSDSKEYSYLFWEGHDAAATYDLTTGFVVKGSDAAEFLQGTLAALGLTPKEYNEFIVYWLPKMIGNEYNLIHFATKEEYDDRAVLHIQPEPDSVLRVFMVFKKLEGFEAITPQALPPFARTGFSVVEWGGTEVK